MYTGTFVVVMILNQLLFFGFCLNPVCLIAAMPHVLFITVIIGTWLNKKNGWGSNEVAGKSIKEAGKVVSTSASEINKSLEDFNDEIQRDLEKKQEEKDLRARSERNKRLKKSLKILDELEASDEEVLKNTHHADDLTPRNDYIDNKNTNEYFLEEPPSWLDEIPPWLDEIPPWLDESQSWATEIPPWLVNEMLSDGFLWAEENSGFADKLKEYGISSIWHITHRNNIKEIISKGLLSNSLAYQSEKPIDISNQGVQRWRDKREPIYNRKIHEYAPAYLNIKNPMLYVRKDMHDELCLIEISLAVLSGHEFIFSDGNAAARDTHFFSNVNDLTKLPWDVLNASYWNDFPDGKRKRCAEVLIFPLIESRYILKIHCRSRETLKYVQKLNFPAQISDELFFGKSKMTHPSSTFSVEDFYDDRPF
ncbi:MAG: DarT ssDNA thymidine ADP-ribosyltransferase family protein [Pseudomonadota bacterium]